MLEQFKLFFGGVDASALSISNLGVITFNNPPNFETQSSYNLTISVSDGLETVSQPLVINIQNTNSPPTINNLETILLMKILPFGG